MSEIAAQQIFKLIIMMTDFIMSTHPLRGEKLTVGGQGRNGDMMAQFLKACDASLEL